MFPVRQPVIASSVSGTVSDRPWHLEPSGHSPRIVGHHASENR
jgi:hypothetical protein